MVGLFPDSSTVYNTFLPTSCFYKPKAPTPHPQKRPIFSAWSAADQVKDKAVELSESAAKEYEKASSKAQAKVGGIELYSGKYYAACTVGGILACVRIPIPFYEYY
jgi:solute carrier family 25 (mitochondrial phosphate transporter), member 3